MVSTKSLLMAAILATGYSMGAKASAIDVTNLDLTAYKPGQELLGVTDIALVGGGDVYMSSSSGFVVKTLNTPTGTINVLDNLPTSSGAAIDTFRFASNGLEGLREIKVELLGPNPNSSGEATLSATKPLNAAQLTMGFSSDLNISAVEIKTEQFSTVPSPGTLGLMGAGLLPLFGRRKINMAPVVA